MGSILKIPILIQSERDFQTEGKRAKLIVVTTAYRICKESGPVVADQTCNR